MSYIVRGVRTVMGTFVVETVVHPHPDEAKRASCAAFDEIYRINDLMSIHRENSEVNVLNRNGFYRGISTDTKCVLERAHNLSELSDGAFDVTILPILRLWERSACIGKVPTDAEISRALELVNYKNIMVENSCIQFRKAGMGITVAGVAKGYAVDKAIEALKRGNIRHALVNAGGDIRVIGGKTETIPWRIAIRDPRDKTRIVTDIELREQAIATSGTYQRSFSDIINPRIGRPSQGLLSSTIIAEKAIDADILSTCVFILGAERGIELLGRLDGVKAFLITRDGDILNYPELA
jgi:thiamine biosynthesis lipoprotein